MSRDREYNSRRRSPEPESRQRHDDSRRYQDRDDRRHDDRDDRRHDDRNGRDDQDGRQGSDNDDYHDDSRRERSPVDTSSKGGQAKGQRARGRWKDAGEDQVRLEKRQARLDRMKKVMRLFEDSLLIDQVALKDKKELTNDVRERLEELKREHAERVKEQVTSHWTNLTKEGGESRGREGEGEGEGNRHRARPARSGQLYHREKSRIVSGNATHNGRGHNSRGPSPGPEHSPERTRQNDGRNDSERDRYEGGNEPHHRRDISKSPDNDRMSNRNDTRGDNRDERRDSRQDNKRNEPSRNRDAGYRRPNPRGQDSGNVTNRRRNRLDSGGTRR